MEIKDVCNLMVVRNDDKDTELTVRDYLQELLELLVYDPEGFSGKRPFGNSCWQHDFYSAFAKAGLVKGEENEWGVWEVSWGGDGIRAAHTILLQCIKHIFEEKQ